MEDRYFQHTDHETTLYFRKHFYSNNRFSAKPPINEFGDYRGYSCWIFFYINMQYPGNVVERKIAPSNKGYIANACLWPFTLAIETTALLMTMRLKYPLHLSTTFYHKNPCIICMTSRQLVAMIALWKQNSKIQHR